MWAAIAGVSALVLVIVVAGIVVVARGGSDPDPAPDPRPEPSSAELDTAKAEAEIEKGLKEQLNLRSVQVSCPEEIEIRAGATFKCPVTAGGETGTIDVTQQDDRGNIRWELRQESVTP